LLWQLLSVRRRGRHRRLWLDRSAALSRRGRELSSPGRRLLVQRL